MIGVETTAHGVDDVSRMFDGLRRRIRNPGPGWERVVDELRAGERRVFASRGASIGMPWEPLAESTLRKRAAAGQGSAPLTATGRLAAELTGTAQVRTRGDEAVFGTRRFYARFVSRRRPMVGADAAAARAVADEMCDYLIGA